ncbi:MAG: hypothetical protein EA357_11075 [Micavibrio sp.]|nr:MAG: hypothetical protein EA357_11075 [Micavibrio sp.]
MSRRKFGRSTFLVLFAAFGAATLGGVSDYLEKKNFENGLFSENAVETSQQAVIDRRLAEGGAFEYVHVIGGNGKHMLGKMAVEDAKIGAIFEVTTPQGETKPVGMVNMYLPGDDRGFELAALRINNALKVSRGECGVNVIFEAQEPVTSCSRWSEINSRTVLPNAKPTA